MTFTLVLSVPALDCAAQDERAQYPSFLARSYFDVGVGYIDYPFSARQLEPGFQVEATRIPHTAARLTLLGYRFDEHLAAQVIYMRPVECVKYDNVNGVPATRTVWMNVAGLTLRASAPLRGGLSIAGEAGFGIVTRHGFADDGIPILKDANYGTVLVGGGLRYALNRSWELGASAIYAPPHASAKQPHTLLVSTGFTYNMRPLSEERVKNNSRYSSDFPRELVQVSYASDASGFGVNAFVSTGAVPVFWGGLAQVRRGFALQYNRNVFHTRRMFALDVGVSIAQWKSRRDNVTFYTPSVFPVFRFTPLHLGVADAYLNYSLAGPALITKVVIDGEDTGRHFTFQDYLGVGVYAGRHRQLNAEVRIGHYSNGNLFSQNAGVSIPLTFVLGYTFH